MVSADYAVQPPLSSEAGTAVGPGPPALAEPAHVAITGASGGLGRALAEHYAAPNRRLSLAGRDPRRLAACAAACQAKGALVSTAVFDLRDHLALRDWLRGLHETQPLDLVFANAGVSASSAGTGLEHPEDAARLLEINAGGTIETARAAAELMLERRRGQIIIVSSLAAFHPLKSSPAYCAGKAASRLYGLSLRAFLAAKGVGVTVVSPGYVDTPMSRRLKGKKPFLWSAEKAAAHIARGLAANPREIAFPRLIAWGLRLLSLLPESIAGLFMKRFDDFSVEPDHDSPWSSEGGHERRGL
jgi:short-subunit dehydrogenase